MTKRKQALLNKVFNDSLSDLALSLKTAAKNIDSYVVTEITDRAEMYLRYILRDKDSTPQEKKVAQDIVNEAKRKAQELKRIQSSLIQLQKKAESNY